MVALLFKKKKKPEKLGLDRQLSAVGLDPKQFKAPVTSTHL